MKKWLLAGAIATALSASAITAMAADDPNSWKIDPNHSTAVFVVRHDGISNIQGSFSKLTGTVVLNDADMTKSVVNASIDMASVDTRVAPRDKDIMSPNYFDVAQYPTATFQSTKIVKAAGGSYKMTGNLTMHGVTKEVTFDLTGPSAMVKFNRTLRRGAEATLTIKRTDFGMPRGIDDMSLADEVKLTVDVEMIQPDPNAPPPPPRPEGAAGGQAPPAAPRP